MKIEEIEVEVIMGKNTSSIVTESILKLYDNNVSKMLDILDIYDVISSDKKAQ
ncbi:hypothetical protein IRP63_07215 [Clostridium botulinum]|uniref:hypothetical protein n=1 Tax=Clostridium botulinum TaxID=1491 RepID=UPI000A494B4E|nr:hypothetical protein [Clostridium botulinum]MCD3232707.1 hypothetical protein [Clostridium botulinum D/C]MCD3238569.1 hypothetical protein [Clostridium botulinum D/C]MCD3266117.1 hypothetical protein [Clostridium botulinum D/C]MCD3301215.1 hypothetical protein [Clostridium botulinum D/C]MCD3304356.1 hypothetical protein [Clostridium botulinum D/C]